MSYQRTEFYLYIIWISSFIICGELNRESAVSEDASDFLHFIDYTRKYKKEYQSLESMSSAYETYLTNMDEIKHINIEYDIDGETSLRNEEEILKNNYFLDITPDEFESKYLSELNISEEEILNSEQPTNSTYEGSLKAELEDNEEIVLSSSKNFDWRSKSVDKPPRNQGLCGSCYAFAAISQLESQYAITYKKNITLSEQQIVSCNPYTYACNGGNSPNVYKYLQIVGAKSGISYPYSSFNNSIPRCLSPQFPALVKIGTYYSAGTWDEASIANWLRTFGPWTVAINAKLWQYYSSGIILGTNKCDPNTLNHAVTLVGYGVSSKGRKYWILKNSWGANWGEKGYFRFERGIGLCGVNRYVHGAKIK